MIINKKLEGGKVIASGGFGCIFEPALQCKENFSNSLQSDSHRKISKLMTKKHAEDEYKQIEQFNSLLNVIPNYENYFLLNNFKLCSPTILTKDDLKEFRKKCKPLKKKGINASNINQSLDKVMSINMPNGGIDVEQFIKKDFSSSNIIRLNNALIGLLQNGIVPMNKLNVYHCDIKDGNVLVQTNESIFKTRLIDWGLSFVYNTNTTINRNKNKNGIPRKIYRRPFQFNVPFSSVFFNKDFLLLYNNFLKLHPKPDYFQIREFVINYIFIWNDIRGAGHLSAINDLIKKLTIKDLTAIKSNKIKEHFIEYDFTYYYIIEYLSKILEKYTNNGELELMSYFENVFLKNIDIWGFTMIYVVLYEYFYESFNKLNHYQMEFISKLKYILIHFLYETPISPIDVSLLVNELTNLNSIIEKFDTNHASIKLEYVASLEENIGGFIKHKKIKTVKRRYSKKRKTRKMK